MYKPMTEIYIKFCSILKHNWIAILALFFSSILIYIYYQRFVNNIDFDGALGGTNEFGTFGDFLGGTLNPILGFLTIVLLLRSLRIQTHELQESRRVITETKDIHRQSLEEQRKLLLLMPTLEFFLKQCEDMKLYVKVFSQEDIKVGPNKNSISSIHFGVYFDNQKQRYDEMHELGTFSIEDASDKLITYSTQLADSVESLIDYETPYYLFSKQHALWSNLFFITFEAFLNYLSNIDYERYAKLQNRISNIHRRISEELGGDVKPFPPPTYPRKDMGTFSPSFSKVFVNKILE